MIFLAGVLLLLVVALAFLLIRATKRLLQFDYIWEALLPELIEYESDLRKMAGGDLLIDHPEVQAFHKRNLRALKAVADIVKSVSETRPPPPPALPRPEVE